jgi:pyridoxine 5-phosphate synthase
MEFVPEAMVHAAATGADRIEIYTEPYAAAFGTPRFAAELARVRETARAAVLQGLSVNAGHDLNLLNTPVLAREVAEISEVSIGHALIADALYLGVAETVRRYVQACRGQDVVAPETH